MTEYSCEHCRGWGVAIERRFDTGTTAKYKYTVIACPVCKVTGEAKQWIPCNAGWITSNI